MSENMNENSEQNTGNNAEMDPLKNLSSLNSIMQLANNLMKNEALMNSVAEIRKIRENPAHVSNVSETQKNAELAALSETLEIIANDISVLKQQSAYLASLFEKLENISNDISELKKELIGPKKQSIWKKIFGIQ